MKYAVSQASPIRLIDRTSGDTIGLVQSENVTLTVEDRVVMVNLDNAIELENDNLNVYEEEKKNRLDKLHKLLKKNEKYYINKHCFGEYYGKEKIKEYRCSQCGDYNGSWGKGKFKELFLGDVTSQLEYPFTVSISELGIEELFEIDEFENYTLKDKSDEDEVLNRLMNHKPLYEDNVYFSVEDENFTISMNEVPKKYIKKALIHLMTNAED